MSSVKYFPDIHQGSEEWYAARLGLLTASEMKLIITPSKLQYACNDKEKSHLHELVAQRITGYIEPNYVGDSMLRGWEDEIYARQAYSENYSHVTEVGFITNNKWGFTIGYSPDGLVGDDGLIECKSRLQKYQIETIIVGKMPDDFLLQVQTGLLVSERKWLDFISYSGGLPMTTIRILPDKEIQDAIVKAANVFENKIKEKVAAYHAQLSSAANRLISTERRIHQEISI